MVMLNEVVGLAVDAAADPRCPSATYFRPRQTCRSQNSAAGACS
jgi:hypothetical protein